MIDVLKESLWKQFGASIDMLRNAVERWPDPLSRIHKRFFYMAYHTAVFLDYYLTIPPKSFSPPLPYTLTKPADIPKEAIDDIVPDKIYSKDELLSYIQLSREKCKNVLAELTEDELGKPWIDASAEMYIALSSRDALNYSVLEILLYNMKHVQHHAAQLNLLLRQTANDAPDYVSHAEDEL